MKDIPGLLKSFPIFSHLSPSEIEDIARMAKTINLQPGEILFYKGDHSKDLYVVILGRLMATTQEANQIEPGEFIGHISPGEVVGEMSLLTGAPRSLTIISEHHSSLLLIPHVIFNEYCKRHANVAFKILEVVAQRSQNIIRQLDNTYRSQFIAVLPSHPFSEVSAFIEQLRKKINNLSNLILLDSSTFSFSSEEGLLESLSAFKKKNNSIIYFINAFSPTKQDKIFMEYVDKVLILSEGGKPFEMDDRVKHFLDFETIPKNSQNGISYELALIYNNSLVKPHQVSTWLEKIPLFRHHHVYLDNSETLKRLVRFLNGTAVGLVFGGGGLLKGWALLGVVKYLQESKIPVDIVGGTSIGAIIGGAVSKDIPIEDLIKQYQKDFPRLLENFSVQSLTLPIVSIFSGKSATLMAKQSFDLPIEHLPKPFFCISCNITQKEEVIHKEGPLWEALRASASLPGLIPPMVIDGNLHVDGGVVNNLPVNVMSRYLENQGTVIGVSLSRLNKEKGNYFFPPTISFFESLLIRLGFKKYRYPSFLNTFIDSLLMGSHIQQKQNLRKADVLIEPSLGEYSMLSRSASYETLIQAGYVSAKEAIENQPSLKLLSNG